MFQKEVENLLRNPTLSCGKITREGWKIWLIDVRGVFGISKSNVRKMRKWSWLKRWRGRGGGGGREEKTVPSFTFPSAKTSALCSYPAIKSQPLNRHAFHCYMYASASIFKIETFSGAYSVIMIENSGLERMKWICFILHTRFQISFSRSSPFGGKYQRFLYIATLSITDP